MKLNKDQKQEIWNWRKVTNDAGGDVGPKNSNKKYKKAMAAAIEKKVDGNLDAREKEKEKQV